MRNICVIEITPLSKELYGVTRNRCKRTTAGQPDVRPDRIMPLAACCWRRRHNDV